jgi:hypothetical protein
LYLPYFGLFGAGGRSGLCSKWLERPRPRATDAESSCRAQSGCSVEKLQGHYVFTGQGTNPHYGTFGAIEAARARKNPAVIHADGTGRIQIVRAEDDPLTYAYLKALGRHIGVEVSVNTSFNVAGPIAQTPGRAIDTLRRSRELDVMLLVASDGAAYAAWHGGERDSGRFTGWLSEWQTASAGR